MDLGLFLDLDRLGERIRNCRRESSMTLLQLAAAASVSPEHLLMIEAGEREPSLSCFVRLARALGVSAADLLPPTV